MKTAAISLAIASALAVNAAPVQKRDLSTYSFTEFTREFGKSYSADELERRKLTFAKNLEAIMAHNSNSSDSTWVAGVNKFTDWTNEEFRASHGHRTQPLTWGTSAAWQPTGKDIPASVVVVQYSY